MKSWEKLKEEIANETKRIWLEEPDDLKKIRLGYIESEAGSYGQYFTTWDFVNGELRALGCYLVFGSLRAAQDPDFNLEQLKKMLVIYSKITADFLRYCGLKKMWKYTEAVYNELDNLETKEDFVELVSEYQRYLNQLVSWSHFYFPWGIGAIMPIKKKEEIIELAKLVGK